MIDQVRVGLIGSQFVSTVHARSLQHCPYAVLHAVASPTPGNAARFARQFGIPHALTQVADLLSMKEVDMVVIGTPNDVHCELTVAAAAAGKHVVVEKPLCLTLAQADEMTDACRAAGVKLMYAEELCFAPKYVRMKQLLDDGALGVPTLLKQSEKHDGPHADHFWDVRRAGGGVTMDLGCHAIEFFRWLLGRPKIKSVYAQMDRQVHLDKTWGEDNALLILEFENGVTALAEESWTKLGGMDDRAEVHGSLGVAYANLLQGNALTTYSAPGYGYAVEKGGKTQGWSFTIYEEEWNYGFHHEMAHFVDCVRQDLHPAVTGEDGRTVLEVIYAAYLSAATGQKVELPWTGSRNTLPIAPWLESRGYKID